MPQERIKILGIGIDPITLGGTERIISRYLRSKKANLILTPNPEILLRAESDRELKNILKEADLVLPDGRGLLWAASFEAMKVKAKRFRTWEIIGQFVISYLAQLFKPQALTRVIPERVSGSDVVYKVAKICEQHNCSLFLLGGGEGVAALAGKNLCQKFLNLKIAGTYSGSPDQMADQMTRQIINRSAPEGLLVGFGAPKQEKWLWRNINFLPTIKLAMVVGGTFDFLSGKLKRAPKRWQKIGLEWLWRLWQEPSRILRILRAVFVFPWRVLVWKIHRHRDYRRNVLVMVLNDQDEVLLINNTLVAKRSGRKCDWQMVQGGVEKGEKEEEAVRRELLEEVGTDKFQIIGRSRQGYQYDWRPAIRPKRPFRGQRQAIWYVKFIGDNSDIRLDPKSHDDFKWIWKENLTREICPARRSGVVVALKNLPDVLNSFNKSTIK